MKYEAVLYFDGPLSNFPKWTGKPDEREVIGRKTFRFRSFALGWARGRLKGMQNCGLVVLECSAERGVTREEVAAAIEQGNKATVAKIRDLRQRGRF